MKQFFTLLSAAVLGLLAASCNMEDVYTINNADDIVTVKGDYLVSDYGTTYLVTEDKTGSTDWRKDDTRLYVLFDVLNRSLEISLKEAHPFTIQEAEPLSVLEETPKDPVVVALQNVSGGYVNLALQIYKEKGTECPHDISFQYRMNPNGYTLELFVLHEGNNENPTVVPEDDLKTEIRFYSIPVTALVTAQTTQVTLTLDALAKNSEGKYLITRQTYQLVRNSYSY